MGFDLGENSNLREDTIRTIEEVQLLLRRLDQPIYIVGIDFTTSNEWTGKDSFGGRSLHDITASPNPYENSLRILGRLFENNNNVVHCFGFGDVRTSDEEVFSFLRDEYPCSTFLQALSRYREILRYVKLGAPTSFAPLIEKAIGIVEKSGGEYHVLYIITDGQVTRGADTGFGQLSTQEQRTMEAIEKASEYPLSIVLIGVGDGPWDTMSTFINNIANRVFRNIEFVKFTDAYSQDLPQPEKEASFASAAVRGLFSQYQAIYDGALLHNRSSGKSVERAALPPPTFTLPALEIMTLAETEQTNSAQTEPSQQIPSGTWSTTECPVCCEYPLNMALGCGHRVCTECAPRFDRCPMCRKPISLRLRLHN